MYFTFTNIFTFLSPHLRKGKIRPSPPSPSHQDFESRSWEQARSGQSWEQERSGQSWEQERSGQSWEQERIGQSWEQARSGQSWEQARSGQEPLGRSTYTKVGRIVWRHFDNFWRYLEHFPYNKGKDF